MFSLKSKYSVSCLWILWPGFSAMFSPLPPLYSLSNWSHNRSILSNTDWWMEHLSEWSRWREISFQHSFQNLPVEHVLSSWSAGAQGCSCLAILYPKFHIAFISNTENIYWYTMSFFQIDFSKILSIFTTKWYKQSKNNHSSLRRGNTGLFLSPTPKFPHSTSLHLTYLSPVLGWTVT